MPIQTAPSIAPSPSPSAASDDDKRINLMVVRLNAICRSTTLDFALRVGDAVVASFYGGRMGSWRGRDQLKDASLRKLARHPDLPMSPSALYRCVAIYEVCSRLPVTALKHVSTAHVRLVLPLQESAQAPLLMQAEAERWSVRKLDQAVHALVKDDPQVRAQRGGAERRSPLKKAMRVLEYCISLLHTSMDPDIPAVLDAPLETTGEAIELLRRAAQMLASFEARLAASFAAPDHRRADPTAETNGQRS